MKAKVKDGKLVIEIPLKHIKAGVEHTLAMEDKDTDIRVTSEAKMGKFFASRILDFEYGYETGPAIDVLLDKLAEEAYVSCEPWLEETDLE